MGSEKSRLADYRQYTLNQWLHHIQVQHWRSIEMSLDRISEVWSRLGGQRTSVVFTVAGTNGKGSCVALLESVLRRAGLRTGSYTSPHLVRYNERVCIDGLPVEDEILIRAFCQIEQARADIPLTYFEFGTLCALLVFQQQDVVVSILETGMGGRLDAVNMIDNDLALITSIGLDHEQWLGSDREKIGAEKAGIIKPGGRVVCGDPNPPDSIARAAQQENALLLQSGQDFFLSASQTQGDFTWCCENSAMAGTWRFIEHIEPPIYGQHQLYNLSAAIATLGITQHLTGVSIDQLRQGLGGISLPGRCQVIATEPMVILDVAHNADSAHMLAEFLHTRPVTGITYAIFGVLGDKALTPIVENISSIIDRWHCVTLGGERGQTAAELERQLVAIVPTAQTMNHPDPVTAFHDVMSMAKDDDRIVIFGSFHTVGDIIGALEQKLAPY